MGRVLDLFPNALHSNPFYRNDARVRGVYDARGQVQIPLHLEISIFVDQGQVTIRVASQGRLSLEPSTPWPLEPFLA
jgi:hypothetical protein